MKTNKISFFAVSLLFLFLLSCSKDISNTEEDWTSRTKQQITNSRISKDKVYINSDDATIVANIFNQQNKNLTRTAPNKQIEEISTLYNDAGEPLMYIINYTNNNGFTIVSATKKFFPIIAYSDKGTFDTTKNSDSGVSTLLEEYKAIIRHNETQPDSIINQYRRKWLEFEEPEIQEPDAASTRVLSNYEISVKKEEQRRIWTEKGYECHNLSAIRYFFPQEFAQGYLSDICEHTDPNYDCEQVNLLLIKRHPMQTTGPLLQTEWHQEYPFSVNAPNGSAGCVPIAIAQIAKYHQWPNTYNWAQIPNNPGYGSAPELERFIQDVRRFAKVTYESDGTSSNTSKAIDAFHTLNYTTTLMNYKRNETAIEIIRNRPVYMSGIRNKSIGHAWVCDGYKFSKIQYAALILGDELFRPNPPKNPDYYFFEGTYDDITEYLHMNWGWGSDEGNGWYIFDDIYIQEKDRNYIYDRQIIKVSPNK